MSGQHVHILPVSALEVNCLPSDVVSWISTHKKQDYYCPKTFKMSK